MQNSLMAEKLYEIILCFVFFQQFLKSFETSPHRPRLFRRMLQHYFAVKLRKRFVDCETFKE